MLHKGDYIHLQNHIASRKQRADVRLRENSDMLKLQSTPPPPHTHTHQKIPFQTTSLAFTVSKLSDLKQQRVPDRKSSKQLNQPIRLSYGILCRKAEEWLVLAIRHPLSYKGSSSQGNPHSGCHVWTTSESTATE